MGSEYRMEVHVGSEGLEYRLEVQFGGLQSEGYKIHLYNLRHKLIFHPSVEEL